MRFNNIEEISDFDAYGNQVTSESTTKMLKSVGQHIERRKIERNCQQIARGILLRLNINSATKELTPLLGDLNSNNNLDATTQWVFDLSPQQDSITKIDMDEFASQLRDFIEDELNW